MLSRSRIPDWSCLHCGESRIVEKDAKDYFYCKTCAPDFAIPIPNNVGPNVRRFEYVPGPACFYPYGECYAKFSYVWWRTHEHYCRTHYMEMQKNGPRPETFE